MSNKFHVDKTRSLQIPTEETRMLCSPIPRSCSIDDSETSANSNSSSSTMQHPTTSTPVRNSQQQQPQSPNYCASPDPVGPDSGYFGSEASPVRQPQHNNNNNKTRRRETSPNIFTFSNTMDDTARFCHPNQTRAPQCWSSSKSECGGLICRWDVTESTLIQKRRCKSDPTGLASIGRSSTMMQTNNAATQTDTDESGCTTSTSTDSVEQPINVGCDANTQTDCSYPDHSVDIDRTDFPTSSHYSPVRHFHWSHLTAQQRVRVHVVGQRLRRIGDMFDASLRQAPQPADQPDNQGENQQQPPIGAMLLALELPIPGAAAVVGLVGAVRVPQWIWHTLDLIGRFV